MTTPPAPPAPAPPAPSPPAPSPPAPSPPAPPSPPSPPSPPGDSADELRRTLDAERKAHQRTQATLAKLQADGMTAEQKALADAKAEGRAEAAAEHARELAAAQFRAAAAGKIADPDAALELLDLAKLVKDGKPDQAAITAAVERLAAVPPPPGSVPPGPRSPGPAAEPDFFRTLGRRG